MEIVVVPFAQEHLPLVERFSEEYWDRPRSATFYRWRYLEAQPFSRMFIGIGEGRCLAMVFALRKEYAIAGQSALCLEVFDWHCLPSFKGTGVGIRVMRAMMRQPERVIALGGTADVLSALPAMGWQQIAVGQVFELPTSGEVLAAGLKRRAPLPAAATRLPLDAVARIWFGPRIRKAPGTGRADNVSMLSVEADALYEGETGYDMVQRPRAEVLRWLSSKANNGTFEYLQFSVHGHLRGWALTRLYDRPEGREGAIVDLFAPRPDFEVYTWMVSEAAVSLAAANPRMIRARATCPILSAALRANHFRATEPEVPVHTWPRGLDGLGRIHVTLNHSDEPIRPYRR